MNGTIKVIGGNKLVGKVTPIPNKNSIVAALPACILSDKTITYKNVPKSTDVIMILKMLKLLGASIDDRDFNNLKINCKEISLYKLDPVLGNKIRASILFAGPLLARFGKAEISLPGGCVLGKRSISAHIDSFTKAGVKVVVNGGYAKFTAPKKLEKSYRIWQCEASVTSTENIAMYAAGVKSNFTIIDSASEPHVCDLMGLLRSMGAKVSGIGSNRLEINGSENLKSAVFTAGPDFVDVGGYIVASAVTGGKIHIKGANNLGVIDGIIDWFAKFNIDIQKSGSNIIVSGKNHLFIDSKDSGFPMAADNLPKFVPRPWPGFPVDVLPVMAVLCCKTKGRVLIQNWMYETGLEFVKVLNEMGANFFMCDPQRVISSGPVKFKGGVVVSPSIIQACMAIFLASLADPVGTTIHGVDILKRRYPNIFEVYKKLGANITVL